MELAGIEALTLGMVSRRATTKPLELRLMILIFFLIYIFGFTCLHVFRENIDFYSHFFPVNHFYHRQKWEYCNEICENCQCSAILYVLHSSGTTAKLFVHFGMISVIHTFLPKLKPMLCFRNDTLVQCGVVFAFKFAQFIQGEISAATFLLF